MLHSIEFLCSVVVAFSRLVHVLRKALMAVPAPPAHAGVPPPCSSWRKVHRPAITVLDEKKASTKEVAAPPAVVLGACKSGNAEGAEERKAAQAARVRPPRLVIPVSSAAGRDAFGEAAGRRTDAVEKEADVEVEGEGFWLVSRRGMRHALEDGYGVITNKNGGDSQMAFYGVYDGHGGRAAVDFVSARLGRNIVAALAAMETQRSSEASQKPQEDDDDRRPETTAMRAGYLITDRDFLSQGVRGGACAATALVKDGALYVANLGDCRAVISRDGVATALTTDQTAARGDERTRIESSGGYVSCKNGVWRVQDSLAVSRAFGDASMKEWVVAEPEIKMLRLTPECQFLVIASDGLWNKVSNQEAVDVVSRSNSKSTSACKKLVDMAGSRGSRDDITVMVVDLQRFVQRNRRNQYV